MKNLCKIYSNVVISQIIFFYVFHNRENLAIELLTNLGQILILT